jgi:hypothetical protein
MKAAVRNLANDVLSEDELTEVIWIADTYVRDRHAAVDRFLKLDMKIGIPLPTHTHYQVKYRGVVKSIDYYCMTDIMKGIRFTRNFVENASAHVVSSSELLSEKLCPTARKGIPFGALVDQLDRSHATKDLVDKLRAFNKIVYVRAKHDWNPPFRPKVHIFDKREAIIIYFIARKLGKQIFDEGKLPAKMRLLT